MTDVAERYARQTLLPEVGEVGQRRLARGEVFVHGHGAAARVCALYLAGAGVGRLVVSPRLRRQVRDLNPGVEVTSRPSTGSEAIDGPSTPFRVHVSGDAAAIGFESTTGSAVETGAAAALAALKRLLERRP